MKKISGFFRPVAGTLKTGLLAAKFSLSSARGFRPLRTLAALPSFSWSETRSVSDPARDPDRELAPIWELKGCLINKIAYLLKRKYFLSSVRTSDLTALTSWSTIENDKILANSSRYIELLPILLQKLAGLNDFCGLFFHVYDLDGVDDLGEIVSQCLIE